VATMFCGSYRKSLKKFYNTRDTIVATGSAPPPPAPSLHHRRHVAVVVAVDVIFVQPSSLSSPPLLQVARLPYWVVVVAAVAAAQCCAAVIGSSSMSCGCHICVAVAVVGVVLFASPSELPSLHGDVFVRRCRSPVVARLLPSSLSRPSLLLRGRSRLALAYTLPRLHCRCHGHAGLASPPPPAWPRGPHGRPW